MARSRDPRTKEQVLDRILSFDFEGDIREIGEERAHIKRIAPNRMSLTFPASDVTYELTVRRPRSGERRDARQAAEAAA